MSAGPRTQTGPMNREALGIAVEPVRMVHLGLGAFHRAHQAWYVHRANQADGFGGIAAFTGRRPDAAAPLAAQDGLYHVLVKDGDERSAELVTSISAVGSSTDAAAWRGAVADPAVGILTVTVTEHGYLLSPAGRVDPDHPVLGEERARLAAAQPAQTGMGRLVEALDARRRAGSPGLTLLSCDNLIGNGVVLGDVVGLLAEAADPGLAEWIRREVAFPSSMVDRIAPRPTEDDQDAVRALTGLEDRGVVATEPFSQWIVADGGALPQSWIAAGVLSVDDVAPYEQRKLRLLNAGHLGLAYLGERRGLATTAEAVRDETCRQWLLEWWDEAQQGLPFSAGELAEHRQSLLERFGNRGIAHLLSQIGIDGSRKIPLRLPQVIAPLRRRGELPHAAARLLAAWVASLRRGGAAVRDGDERLVAEARSGELSLPALLGRVIPGIEDDPELIALIERLLREESDS